MVGGAREVLPLRKVGSEKVLAMLKPGHKTFWDSFSHIPLFKGGTQNVLPCLEGAESVLNCDFPIL